MVLPYLNVTDIQDNLERDRFEIKHASAFTSLSVLFGIFFFFYPFSFSFLLFFFLNFTLSDSLSLFLYSHIKNYKGGNARRKIKDIKQSHKRSKCKPEKQQEKRGVGKGSDFFGGALIFKTHF